MKLDLIFLPRSRKFHAASFSCFNESSSCLSSCCRAAEKDPGTRSAVGLTRTNDIRDEGEEEAVIEQQPLQTQSEAQAKPEPSKAFDTNFIEDDDLRYLCCSRKPPSANQVNIFVPSSYSLKFNVSPDSSAPVPRSPSVKFLTNLQIGLELPRQPAAGVGYLRTKLG